MFFRVAKIQTMSAGQYRTNATGFFYMEEDFLYLVTARHVVIDEKSHHQPDAVQLSLHADAAHLQHREELAIPLYLNGIPQWFEHPKHRQRVDLVAIAINDPRVLDQHVISTFCSADIVTTDESVPMRQQVLIPGFPLGFHDTLHNLPIVRSAMIASSFAHPFKGEPYFLTDARLHRGMSGSPVIIPSRAMAGEDTQTTSWRLLGVHTSAVDVSNRDPAQDEKLNLNSAWYASLIPEMIRRLP